MIVSEIEPCVMQYKECPNETNLLAVWDMVSDRVSQKAKRYCENNPRYSDLEQDITQEAFILLSKALEKFDDRGKTFTRFFCDWYLPQARDIAFFGTRSQKRDLSAVAISGDQPSLVDDEDSPTILETIPDDFDPYKIINEKDYNSQVALMIYNRIDRLSDNYRIVLSRKLFWGMTFKQIHKHYFPDRSYSTVVQYWRYGIKTLRKKLLSSADAKEYEFEKYARVNRNNKSYYSGGYGNYIANGFTSCVEKNALEIVQEKEYIDRLKDAANLLNEVK